MVKVIAPVPTLCVPVKKATVAEPHVVLVEVTI